MKNKSYYTSKLCVWSIGLREFKIGLSTYRRIWTALAFKDIRAGHECKCIVLDGSHMLTILTVIVSLHSVWCELIQGKLQWLAVYVSLVQRKLRFNDCNLHLLFASRNALLTHTSHDGSTSLWILLIQWLLC